MREDKLQKGMLLTDDFTPSPILDFKSYSSTIVNMIKDSYPKISIGIHGEWGSGKTTLMKLIQSDLNNNDNIITIWFNAWRYERENQFALIPLLKTIQFSIPEEKYKNLKEAFKEAGIFGLRISNDFLSGLVTTHLGKMAGDLFKKGLDNFSEKVIPELKKVNEIEKNTIYFDGQKKIENAIKSIRQNNHSFRIVVFVDDLDRCSPTKTLEVLESIKVFLGMEGFIYVMGMSHETLAKLISLKYKETEIKGEEYIKKIIQIPIFLPVWDKGDIIDLLKDLMTKNLIYPKYEDTIEENKLLISEIVEPNPRELKRFINNFITVCEVFNATQNRKIIPSDLLLIQSINIK